MLLRSLYTGIFLLILASVQSLATDSVQTEATPNKPAVGLITQSQILAAIRQGKRVVFVDAREPEEYAEQHLPGAILLPLRELNASSLQQFAADDIIVSYCLKDFRGYEVARALAATGHRQVFTMQAYGLNGWRNTQLPLYIQGKQNEEQALQALQQCANNPSTCLLQQTTSG